LSCIECIHSTARHSAGPVPFLWCSMSNTPEADKMKSDRPKNAADYLKTGVETLELRGVQYDKAGGERSAATAAAMYTALTGKPMSACEGWLFLACVKMARLVSAPGPHDDSALDMAVYAALAGEAKWTHPDTAQKLKKVCADLRDAGDRIQATGEAVADAVEDMARADPDIRSLIPSVGAMLKAIDTAARLVDALPDEYRATVVTAPGWATAVKPVVDYVRRYRREGRVVDNAAAGESGGKTGGTRQFVSSDSAIPPPPMTVGAFAIPRPGRQEFVYYERDGRWMVCYTEAGKPNYLIERECDKDQSNGPFPDVVIRPEQCWVKNIAGRWHLRDMVPVLQPGCSTAGETKAGPRKSPGEDSGTAEAVRPPQPKPFKVCTQLPMTVSVRVVRAKWCRRF